MDKAEKKRIARARNRRDFLTFIGLKNLEAERERIDGLEEAMKPKPEPKQEEVLWSERTKDLRMQLQQRKQRAQSKFEDIYGGNIGGRGL